MTSTESQVREAASRNGELLYTLAKTDYSKPAMEQQNNYILELEKETARNQTTMQKLVTAREMEFKDHRKYHDSTMKRFAYKVGGKKEKFAEKANKEEREYFEALRAEHHAKDEGEQLAKQLQEARRTKTLLEPVAAEHARAQKDLDALYNSIFAGQTPSFPEEDQQENRLREASNEYQRLESMLRAEEQVQQLLENAARSMSVALSQVQSALSASTYDMFGGGGFADYLERSALGQAEMAVAQVYRFVDQARQMSPHVQPLRMVSIAQGNLLSDVFFDNIFTDLAFHEKIKASAQELNLAASQLQQNQGRTEQRVQGLRGEMETASERLESGRKQLQKVREQIFERTLGGLGGEQAPPYYEQ